MGKSTMRALLLTAIVLFLVGCGEAQFYKHIQYQNSSLLVENKTIDVAATTAESLGYRPCGDGWGQYDYCKGEVWYFSIKEIQSNSFELLFFHSFGGYPGPENKNVRKFSQALSANCETCIIKEKESSSWGFNDEESEWVQIYP